VFSVRAIAAVCSSIQAAFMLGWRTRRANGPGKTSARLNFSSRPGRRAVRSMAVASFMTTWVLED